MTRNPSFIPIERHARVVEKLSWVHLEFRARVARDDLEEDGVDAELGVRLGIEDIRLDPPGSVNARASRRRENEDDAYIALVPVERVSQLIDRVQIRPAGVGCATE